MDTQRKWTFRLGFLLLLFIVIYVFWKLKAIWLPIVELLLTVSVPFLVAAFITYLLHPVVEKLHESYFPRWLAILIIYLLFFGGIGFALYKGIPAFILQLRDLSENVPNFINQYRKWIALIQEQTSTWPDGIQGKIDDGIDSIEQALDRFLLAVIDSLTSVFNSIVTISVIPFIAFYMLKDMELIKKVVWYLTPRKWRSKGILFIRDVDKSLGGYLRGQLSVCAVIGTVSSLIFWFIHMKYPLLLGLIIGLTNVIPYFGPFIGLIPALIIAATISVKMVIYSVILVGILQFLEGNILSPLIVGKSLHMHPLLIMLALLTGAEIGGIMGLILAVPILAILKVSLVHARNHFAHAKADGDPSRQH